MNTLSVSPVVVNPLAVNWSSEPAALVTAAYGWGFRDGSGGRDLAASDLFRHADPRWTEFVQGYVAGAQAGGFGRAAAAALSLVEVA